jgi:glycosyltransferase involved in cell wall biosynthesis
VSDPRIRAELLDTNRGAGEAMNIALSLSCGRYVAVCNSDDEWHPDKLRKQVTFLEDNPGIGATFSDVVWIDEDGNPIQPANLPYFGDIFIQKNRSKEIWLRDLVVAGNCLCHPSILIRREFFDVIGGYDNRLRQLPDLSKWIELVQNSDIFVMADKLVSFRLHETNVSGIRPDNSRRSINEHRIIVSELFERISQENFIRSFGLRAISIDNDVQFQIEKGLYLLAQKGAYEGIFRELGLDALFKLLGQPDARSCLLEKYLFDIAEFQREMGVQSPWIPHTNPAASGTVDTLSQPDLAAPEQIDRGEIPNAADHAVANAPVESIRTIDLARILGKRLRAIANRIVRSGPSHFSK